MNQVEVYHGSNNTFIIVPYQSIWDNSYIAKQYCANQYDGFILVKTHPLEMIIYNRDGSIATMCGNGIRCFIHYCYIHQLISELENDVITGSGLVHTEIVSINPFLVRVHMQVNYPMVLDKTIAFPKQVEVNHHIYPVYLVHTGVWHGVVIVTDWDSAVHDAPDLYQYPPFENDVNIDIVRQEDTENIYIKTYERGVGFTATCGTGMMATYAVLLCLGSIQPKEIQIQSDGGVMTVGKNYIVGPSCFIKTYIES